MTTQPIAVSSGSTRVKIQRHEPDFEDHLSDPVIDRLINLADSSPACLYVNPMVTITCESETREFYQAVQKYRGQWCSRVKKTLGPKACRGVRGWAPRRPKMSRRDRYLDYALSVTGVMFINGQQTLKSPGKLSIAEACETFLNPPPAKKVRRILGGKASPADRRKVNRHLVQLLGDLAALVQHLEDLEQRAEQLDEPNGDARTAGRSNKFFTPQLKRLATEAWEETFTAMVQAAEQVGLSPPEALWTYPPDESVKSIEAQVKQSLHKSLALHQTILHTLDVFSIPHDSGAAAQAAMLRVRQLSRVREFESRIEQQIDESLPTDAKVITALRYGADMPSDDDLF